MNRKKWIAAAAAAALLLTGIPMEGAVRMPFLAAAEDTEELPKSGICGDDATWELSPEGVLTVRGTGSTYDYKGETTPTPWLSQADSITKVVVEEGITRLGNYLFYDLEYMTQAVLPNTLRVMSNRCFCYDLRLRTLRIPPGVTTIEEYAFFHNSALRYIIIPRSVRRVGSSAFMTCESLQDFTVLSGSLSMEFDDGTICSYSDMSSNVCVYLGVYRGWRGSLIQTYADYCDRDFVPLYEDFDYGTCGEETDWTLENGLLTIRGYGATEDYADAASTPWANYRTSIRSVVVEDGVTALGSHILDGCTKVTSITLADTVSQLGTSCFAGCEALEELNLPYGVEALPTGAFAGCTALQKVVIPVTVKALEAECFVQCTSLEQLVLPSGLKRAGDRAVMDCPALRALYILSPDCEITPSAFCNAEDADGTPLLDAVIYAPAGSTAEAYAEKYGRSFTPLETLEDPPQDPPLPEGVIPDHTEYLTYKTSEDGTYIILTGLAKPLQNLIIPETIEGLPVREIAARAFKATPLQSVVLPENLDTIEREAFDDCNVLREIHFPEKLSYIGKNVFDDTMWIWDRREEDPLVIESGILIDGYKCEGSVIVPDGVESVCYGAFYRYSGANITDVTLPESVTRISGLAFNSCKSLTEVTILNPLCGIGEDILSGCNATLRGYPDSTAEYYARLYKIPFVPLEESYPIPCGCCGNDMIWKIEDGTLSIIGTGEMSNWSEAATPPWYAWRSGITAIAFEEGITNIGSYAFSGCEALREIRLPSSLHRIGESAFSGCTALTSAAFPEFVSTVPKQCFAGCDSLEEVTLPDSITSICAGAFSECKALRRVSLLSQFCKIEGGAGTISNAGETYTGIIAGYHDSPAQTYAEEHSRTFEDLGDPPPPVYRGECGSNMTWVLRDGTLTIIGSGEMDSKTSPWYPYREEIREVVFDGAPESIGVYAFEYCTELTAIEIPESVTSIEADAFMGCEKLASVKLPERLKYLGNFAFADCKSLRTISYPAGLSTVPGGCFLRSGLERLTLPEGLDMISGNAFRDCENLTELELPSTLTYLGDHALQGCTSLAEIHLLKVNTIGQEALDDTAWLNAQRELSPLVSVNGILIDGKTVTGDCTIPDTVEQIAASAFKGCQGITSVTIPENVSSIGMYAFRNCPALRRVTILNPGCMIYDDVATFTNEADAYSFHGVLAGYENSNVKPYAEDYSRTFESLGTIEIPTHIDEKTGLKYQILGRTISIVGTASEQTDLEIPSSINNMTVTSIGQYAFYQDQTLRSVKLPGTIKLINTGAFLNCSQLSEIEVSTQVSTIGYQAFEGTAWIEAQRQISPMVVAGSVLVSGSGSSGSIKIPNTVERICMWAFSGCESLTSVTLPESVKAVEYAAFYNCPALKSVTIRNADCNINYNNFTFSTSDTQTADGTYPFQGTLYGAEGSTAQSYAQANGRSFALIQETVAQQRGDLNDDGVVNASDAAQLLTAAAQEGSSGVCPLTDEQQWAADMNRDGSCNASDAALILMYAAAAGAGYQGTVEGFLAEQGILVWF